MLVPKKNNSKYYIQLFNNCLIPKHHFLTHYCNIIKQSGPLKYLWTIYQNIVDLNHIQKILSLYFKGDSIDLIIINICFY